MAVTSLYVYDMSGGLDREGNRRYTVVYKATSNDKLDDFIKIIKSSGVPLFAAPYELSGSQDLAATRESIDAERWDRATSALLWRITAVFSTKPLSGVAGPHGVPVGADPINIDDPTTYPPRLSGSFLHTERQVFEDGAGVESLVNPVGDLYEAFKRESHPTLNIEMTQRTISLADLDSWINKLNSTTFFGLAKFKWRLAEAPWRQVFYGRTTYYEVRYTFEANKDTWFFRPARKGPRYKNASGDILPFTDDLGFDFAGGEGPLNADGTRRAVGAVPQFQVITPGFQLDGAINYKTTIGVPDTF